MLYFFYFFLKFAQNKFEILGKNKANKAFALLGLLYIKPNRNCFTRFTLYKAQPKLFCSFLTPDHQKHILRLF